MEIKTLKDLKEALKDIPDKVLDNFGAGMDDERAEMLIRNFKEDYKE